MNAMTIDQLPLEDDRSSVSTRSFNWISRMFKTLETWRLRQKSRAQFAELDSRILRDSGIGDAHRFIESNKPFWEA